MPAGTEQTATNASPIREKPQLSPALEPKQNTHNGSDLGGICARMHEIVGATAGQEPPPQELKSIFRSAEFSQPVNDGQKTRALQTLQRSYGNRYVQRVLEPDAASQTQPNGRRPSTRRNQVMRQLPQAKAIQPKLEVSTPGDALEREADRMAEQVMSMPAPGKQAPAHAGGGQLNRQVETAAQLREHSGGILRAGSAAGMPPPVSPELERSLGAQRGGGQPLPGSTRDFFEPRFGQDLSGVRVHHDAEAADAASEINAQAFTTGRDIYFGAGKYQPQSQAGRRLLAHELAHTVQQGSESSSTLPPAQRVHRELIQRNPPPPSGSTTTSGSTAPAAPITVTNYPLPAFKLSHANYTGRQYIRAKEYTRRRPNAPEQALVWDRAVSHNTAKTKLETLGLNRPDRVYILRARPKFGEKFFAIGNADSIASGTKRPFWRRGTGAFTEHEVDHIVDLVLTGWPRAVAQSWANTPDNMQLLDQPTNSAIGGAFETTITAPLRTAVGNPSLNVRQFLPTADIIFSGFTAGPNPANYHVWTKSDVEQGLHIDALANRGTNRDIELLDVRDPHAPAPFSEHSLSDVSTLGSSNRFVIYKGSAGGRKSTINWNTTDDSIPATNAHRSALFVPGFHCEHITFNRNRQNPSDNVGVLEGHIFKNQQDRGRIRAPGTFPPWNVKPVPGTQFAGFLDFDALFSQVGQGLTLAGLSPIQIGAVGWNDEKGIVAGGRILPTVPLLSRLQLDLVLEGDDLRVERAFSATDLSLPRPFVVNDCTLVLSIGIQSGFQIRGRLDFGIERVGQGFLQASVSTGEGFALEGGFDFDSQTFNPARIRLRYQDNRFSGEGELGIPAGKVRGIRSANITASYADERLVAHGMAEFTIPGLEQGTLDLTYSDAEGMTLAGTLQLGTMPGIRSGSLAAQVRKPAGADEWQLSARGTAVPNIPGVESTLTVAYENGIFTAEARAAYSRGMLSGTIVAGATNRPIDPEGRPVEGGEPARTITPYGQGQLTVRIAPWLQGTIGVRILPNGEIEVSGAIGLPSSLPLFPVKPFNKNIFHIDIDIPIVGVSVLGHRIGIFATIGGGLDVDAGIGPGQLRELGLTITYNPSHEDQTHVTGRAEMFIPAHAGLRLFVRGGLGVGIPIVSATARLVVAATLGLEGAVVARLEVDWMPNRGLILDALGEIYVQPKFRFDVTGEVLVEADLLFTTVELYSHTWNLASFEYGSDLRFGVRFPIHYQEGRPFDISLSDVEFVVPQIDPMDLLTGLIKRI